MDIMMKKWHTEGFMHHSEEKKSVTKVSRHISAAGQRVSTPPAKGGNFSCARGIEIFPLLHSRNETATMDQKVTTTTGSSCQLALELHTVQEELPSSPSWAVLPWWLQEPSKAPLGRMMKPAGSAEPNTASTPQYPATFPQDLQKTHNCHFPAPIPLASL